jgi:hypothetical protein
VRRAIRDPDALDQDSSAVRRAQAHAAVHPLLALQRSAGNQAVGKALAGCAMAGKRVLSRYFDNFAAVTDEEKVRKARFDAFVDRAITAGIAREIAESAGSTTLQAWEGWSDPRLPDFDYAWIDGPRGFKTKLGDRLAEKVKAEPLKALLNAIFAARADDAVLRQLGEAAGFQPGGQQPQATLTINREWEARFLNVYGAKFESVSTGQGRAFELAWQRAGDADRVRILDILLGPGWQDENHEPPSAHLSDMEYVIEGVTGITGTPPMTITSWAAKPTGSLFDHVRAVGGGYKTKYMTPEEREEYRLTIDRGRVTLPTGEPLKGDNIYVLAADNYFFGGAKKSGRGGTLTSEAIHHSTFMAGEPVRGAGHFTTDDSGNLLRVDDQSGHYRPGDYELGLVLYYLEYDKTDLSQVKINRQEPADVFLARWKRRFLPQQPQDTEENTKTEEKVTVGS